MGSDLTPSDSNYFLALQHKNIKVRLHIDYKTYSSINDQCHTGACKKKIDSLVGKLPSTHHGWPITDRVNNNSHDVEAQPELLSESNDPLQKMQQVFFIHSYITPLLDSIFFYD